jgi:hypothetical protein
VTEKEGFLLRADRCGNHLYSGVGIPAEDAALAF